jgi:hypothetical protein
MTAIKKTKVLRQRAMLRLLGFDTRNMTAADIAEGAEAARRITQCDRVPGAGKRAPKAIADFRTFCQRWQR